MEAQVQSAPETPQNDSGWAPGWRSTPEAAQPVNQPPKSFEQAFSQQADDIAKDLGLDTQRQQVQKSPPREPDDPLGEMQLEVAPGKSLSRKDIAKQLRDYEALQKKHAEFERGAGAKFREAAEQRKQAQAQFEAAKQALAIKQRLEQVIGDPDSLLKEAGYDPAQYRQQAIEKAYADAQKSPEQREIDRLKAYEQQVARYEQQEQQRLQEDQQRQQKTQAEQQTQKVAGNLSRSMMATADQMGLPKSALTIQRFANLLSGAQAKGLDPTWKQLGDAVHAQYVEDVVTLVDQLTPEQFKAKIPPKTQQKLRQFFLQQSGQNAPRTEQSAGPQAVQRKPQKAISTSDYNEFINKLRSP